MVWKTTTRASVLPRLWHTPPTMLDTPLQLVCTATHKSHGDLCFQLNFIMFYDDYHYPHRHHHHQFGLPLSDSRVKCWVSRPNVCLCHRAVVVPPEGGMVTVSVPVYNTDTRTQPEHYDCIEQVMMAVCSHGGCFCTGLQH